MEETQTKLQQKTDEAEKLSHEKSVLVGTIKRLNREISRTENFKAQLITSIQEERTTLPLDSPR